MKTTFIYSILFFLLFSATSFCKLKGTWRQVFPEENGAIPGPRTSQYMCSIGDEQVLMLGGLGSGNPHAYRETWLYTYRTNSWTKVECDNTPDSYYSSFAHWSEYLCKISKTRAIWGFGNEGLWLFDIDSLEWFDMHYTLDTEWTGTFLEENVVFGYTSEIPENIYCCGISELIRLHPEEPVDSPDFFTREIINDEEITKQGPNYNYPKIVNHPSNGKYFALYDSMKVTWIPVGKMYDQPFPPSFMNMEREIWNWLFLGQSQDSLPVGQKRKYSQLTKNATLMHDPGYIGNYGSDFYTIEYSPETDQMSTYQIDAPGNGIYNCKLAQIKDGVVMLFGGMLPTGLSNETWIFELDCLDVVDNAGENVKIYILDDNLYMLGDNLKNAVLYNILGQKVVAVSGNKLDLNPLPIGVYFLQYNEKGVEKAIKVVRR